MRALAASQPIARAEASVVREEDVAAHAVREVVHEASDEVGTESKTVALRPHRHPALGTLVQD